MVEKKYFANLTAFGWQPLVSANIKDIRLSIKAV